MKITELSKHPILCPTEEVATAPDELQLSELAEGVIKSVKTRRGQTAIVILQDGTPRAFDARCPHMGSDLTKATCRKGDIVCSWHGYRYSGETGAMLENPNEAIMKAIRLPSAHFDPELKPPYRLRAYELEMKDGRIDVK